MYLLQFKFYKYTWETLLTLPLHPCLPPVPSRVGVPRRLGNVVYTNEILSLNIQYFITTLTTLCWSLHYKEHIESCVRWRCNVKSLKHLQASSSPLHPAAPTCILPPAIPTSPFHPHTQTYTRTSLHPVSRVYSKPTNPWSRRELTLWLLRRVLLSREA